jgi:hypothetical protein
MLRLGDFCVTHDDTYCLDGQTVQQLYIPIEKCTRFLLKSVPVLVGNKPVHLHCTKWAQIHARSGDKSPDNTALLPGRA